MLWQLADVAAPGSFFPGPLATLAAVRELLSWAELRNLLTTLGRTLVAFVLSLGCAVLLALAGQVRPVFSEVVKDLMSFLIRIPSIAAITFLVLLCGPGYLAIYLSVMVIVIPVACLSIIGLYEQLNPGLHTINAVYAVPFHRQARDLYLPTLVGSFHGIFLLSYSLTFKALIMAEFLGGLSGMGYRLMIHRESLDLERMTAYILIIALTGYASQKALEALGRRRKGAAC